MKSTIIQCAFGAAFVGVGWVVASSFEPAADASIRTLDVTASAAAKPTALPPVSSELVAQTERASRYVDRGGSLEELEEFWENCDPNWNEDEIEAVRSELEDRIVFFTDLVAYFGDQDQVELASATTSMTQSEYLAMYAEHAIREADFLLREFEQGRMRIAPFYPVPDSVLMAHHPSSQIVPHVSGERQRAFVARLEFADEPELFRERPEIGRLGMEIMGEEETSSDALRARTRDELSSQSSR